MNVQEWRAPVNCERCVNHHEIDREHEQVRTAPKVGTVYHNKQGRVSGRGMRDNSDASDGIRIRMTPHKGIEIDHQAGTGYAFGGLAISFYLG